MATITTVSIMMVGAVAKLFELISSIYHDLRSKKENNELDKLPYFIRDLTDEQYEEYKQWINEERMSKDIKSNHSDINKSLKSNEKIDAHKILFDKWKLAKSK
jgi:hypothetical protein